MNDTMTDIVQESMMSEMQAAAALARLLGDATRLRLLRTLILHESTVSELLAATDASQSNLSNHLRLLREDGLVTAERQGRQIVYQIATPAIAELVDALFMAVGNEQSGPPPTGPLANARTCYDHLAGKFGVTLLESLAAQHAINLPADSWTDLELGPEAGKIFKHLGIDLDATVRDGTRRRFAYACPDWSEQGHFHAGGLVGAALCDRCLKAGWIERDRSTRAVKLTKSGRQSLKWLIGESF